MEINGSSAAAAAAAAAALATIPPPERVPPEQAAANHELIQAVKAVNEAGTFGENNEITFQIDRNSHLPVVRIIDRTTNEVVEQMPAEYILQLAQTLGQSPNAAVFSALA
jgi:uncharacterized FlaG/YvyC family protein